MKLLQFVFKKTHHFYLKMLGFKQYVIITAGADLTTFVVRKVSPIFFNIIQNFLKPRYIDGRYLLILLI